MASPSFDAESLAQQLDRALPPGSQRIEKFDGEFRLAAAVRLARLRVGEPSPAALRRMEKRMLARYDHLYPRRHESWRASLLLGLRWAAAACLILLVMSAAVLPIAGRSLPGEPFYAVKRAVERVERLLAIAPDAAAAVSLRQAERRAQEALALAQNGQLDKSLILEALDLRRDALERASPALSTAPDFLALQRAIAAQIYAAIALTSPPSSEEAPPAVIATETPTDIAARTRTPSQLTLPATSIPTTIPALLLRETAVETPTVGATMTQMPTNTPTTTATVTATVTATATPTATPTATATAAMPSTTTPSMPTDHVPAGGMPECPGFSCDSAGVPGGQINPASPPGHRGGRNDNRPQPPGGGPPPHANNPPPTLNDRPPDQANHPESPPGVGPGRRRDSK
ncbi:MAG: DUF5667 domain-containing protein [Aggregatilineales bacterium]